MKKTSEFQVGLFALIAILLIGYMSFRVSEGGLFKGGDYQVKVLIDSAEGLTKKTPVEIAGIQVGYIDHLELHEGSRALAILRVNKQVQLGRNAKAQIRTKGFLGETYVDIIPGDFSVGTIEPGGEIRATNPYVDLGQIASDVREVTGAIKKMIADDGQGPVTRILKNMEVFTQKLSEMTVQNQQNVNEIVENLRQFSGNLNGLMAERRETLSETMERINSVSRKIDEGRGTVGQLINDGELAQNLKETSRGLNDTLGGISRYQIEMAYHLEYLGNSRDYKNYAGLIFKPRPDKYFMAEFVVDPEPSPVLTHRVTTITTGGTSSTVTADQSEVERNTFLFSLQFAKKFYDLTLRGGLIESRGGLGFDYDVGPFQAQFSAFDFATKEGRKPHLKALGKLHMTRNLFLVGGMDDFINGETGQKNWFMGAGFQFVDNDIKSLLGAANFR